MRNITPEGSDAREVGMNTMQNELCTRRPCSYVAWLDKSHLKINRSRAMGTQKSVMTQASLTRLELARWFPQFVGKIIKYQMRVA